jgi:hypothetical protein
MRELLMALSAVAVLVFVGVLVFYLLRIVHALESIGGSPQSYLAKLGFGVRAIETETSHLAPQVTQLNQGLTALAGGLGVVEADLRAIAEALAGSGAADPEGGSR